MEQGVTDCTQEHESTVYPSGLPVSGFGRLQPRDLIHDLHPPDLAVCVCTVISRICVRGVIMNPVKDLDDSQFLVETRQDTLPPQHIGPFFITECRCFGLDWGGWIRPELRDRYDTLTTRVVKLKPNK